LPAAAIMVTTLSLAFAALGQQSVRTPDIPPFTTFVPNPEEQTFIRAGPFSGTAELGVGYLYNDNANTTGTEKEALNEFFENVDVDLDWPLSPFNRIDLRLGGQLQQNFYSSGTQTLNFVVRPGSQIQLEAKVGEFLLTAFERFTIIQDPVSDPAVAGQTNLNRLSNTIGAGIDLPLYHADFNLTLSYTYSDQFGGTSSGTTFTSSEGGVLLNSFHLGSKIGFQFSPTLSYGLELNATYNSGDGPEDFYVFSIGPFIRGHITRLLEIDAGIGPLLSAGPAGEPPQYYGFIAVRYQLSRVLQILAGIDHDSEFSSGLGVTQNNNIRLSVQATFNPRWTFTAGPYVNFGTVITGEFPGPYTQFGVTVESIYRFTKRWSADISYRFAKRNGEGSGVLGGSTASYTQNLATVGLNYGF
jgi:predicted porin